MTTHRSQKSNKDHTQKYEGQQILHTEVKSPTKTTFSHTKKKKTRSAAPVISRKFGSEEMWHTSFPDLNPMDFCVCVFFLETKACSVAHTSVEASERSLVREWAKIPQEHYRAVVDEFQKRLDMVIDVKGGHIEK